jgi:hypothetical protein
MTHLNIYNTSYDRKKSQKSKCQFDSQPLKVRNYFNAIGGLHKKLWASKVIGVSILKILRFPTWESRDKMTFGCKFREKTQKYDWGER